jgi:hypothetical protein
MAERQAFIDRVKGAERESYVVAAAVAYHGPVALAGDAQLSTKTSPRNLVAAADEVESTYLIRMWAEFETALRSYRRHLTGEPDDRISTISLIDRTSGVKKGRAISSDVREDAHEVREYRNFLVHERDDPTPPAAVAIEAARKRLNTLLHCLPIVRGTVWGQRFLAPYPPSWHLILHSENCGRGEKRRNLASTHRPTGAATSGRSQLDEVNIRAGRRRLGDVGTQPIAPVRQPGIPGTVGVIATEVPGPLLRFIRRINREILVFVHVDLALLRPERSVGVPAQVKHALRLVGSERPLEVCTVGQGLDFRRRCSLGCRHGWPFLKLSRLMKIDAAVWRRLDLAVRPSLAPCHGALASTSISRDTPKRFSPAEFFREFLGLTTCTVIGKETWREAMVGTRPRGTGWCTSSWPVAASRSARV